MIGLTSEETYRRVALEDRDHLWELYGGRLREKPQMSVERGDIMALLLGILHSQLDRGQYRLRANHARLRLDSGNYFVPDIAVIPIEMERVLRQRPGSLDAYVDPLPLVIEIWSPSTGNYDLQKKLAGYQQRGDQEIWRVHPYERTLTAWIRRPDGVYGEMRYREGSIRSQSLPSVAIDLTELFVQD